MATVVRGFEDTRAASLGQGIGFGIRKLLDEKERKELDRQQQELMAKIANAKDKKEASTLLLSNSKLLRDPARLQALSASVDANFPEQATIKGFSAKDEPLIKSFPAGQPPPEQDEDFFLSKRQPFTIPITDKQGRTTLSQPIEARTREEAQELFSAAGITGRPLDVNETKIQSDIIQQQIDREKIRASGTSVKKSTDKQLELINLAAAEGLDLNDAKQQLIARNLVPATLEASRSNFEQLLTTSFGKEGFAIFAKNDAALVTEGTVNLRSAIRQGVEPSQAIKVAHLDTLKEKALAEPSALLGTDAKNDTIDAASKQSAVEGFIRAMGVTPADYERRVNAKSSTFQPGLVRLNPRKGSEEKSFVVLVLPNGTILPWSK